MKNSQFVGITQRFEATLIFLGLQLRLELGFFTPLLFLGEAAFFSFFALTLFFRAFRFLGLALLFGDASFLGLASRNIYL